MSRFKEGHSIERLRELYLEDSGRLAPNELALRYGRDVPRFMGQDAARRMRPTSKHLSSALYEDDKGRRYSPEYDTASDTWWVSIPPRYARRYKTAVRNRDVPEPSALDEDGSPAWREFPQPQEELRLRRIVYARENEEHKRNAAGAYDTPYSVKVTVLSLITTRATASACVILENPLDSATTAEQRAGLEHRSGRDLEQRRRMERQSDRTYD